MYGLDKFWKKKGAWPRKNYERLEREVKVKKIRADAEGEAGWRNVTGLDLASGK